MNFFKKRKGNPDEGETSEPNSKRTRPNRLISWLKDKFTKNTESETPVHRRTVRYVMTPEAAFSPSIVTTDLRNRTFYELNSVVNVSESKNYEFKAAGGRYPTHVLPEHIRKYGSGFLNSSGGVLLAGILDNGSVQGVRYCNPSYQKNILSSIQREFDQFRPRVGQNKYSVKFVPVSFQQNYFQHANCFRTFAADTFVIEIVVKQGDPGELYEDGLHQVFVRREGSVEGPLPPIKIKDLVLQDIREVLQDKKRKRTDLDSSETAVADSSFLKDGTPIKRQPMNKKGKFSPITFDLKVADRII